METKTGHELDAMIDEILWDRCDEIECAAGCTCDACNGKNDNALYKDTQTFANTKTHTLKCAKCVSNSIFLSEVEFETIDNNGNIRSYRKIDGEDWTFVDENEDGGLWEKCE